MTIPYNQTAALGAGIISVLGIAGGIFLGLGVTAQGHTWQLITGSSLLGIGVVSALAFSCYMLIPRSGYQIAKAFENDTSGMWTYGTSSTDGKTWLYMKRRNGILLKIGVDAPPAELSKWCTRVIVPFFNL